jgi:chemotaxis protein methyltransferase CheR
MPRDAACAAFLEWALPHLRMRWPGFRRVRSQVCKRVARRLKSLALPDVAAYRAYIEAHPDEWAHLDELCRISISRFYRDRAVWEYLASEVLRSLAERAASQGELELRLWSIGCAAGEECYTVTILWRCLLELRFPNIALRILGTDADQDQLARARMACYPGASLKEMPLAWRQEAFEERGGRFCLRQAFQAGVELQQQDIRRELPDGTFISFCAAISPSRISRRICSARSLPRSTTGSCPVGCSFSASRRCFPGAPWDLSNALLTCASTTKRLVPRYERGSRSSRGLTRP